MFRILAALFPFIKELFFDKKDEMDFKSPYFNVKKWLQYVLFIISFTIILFTGGRLITITSKYIKLEKEYQSVKTELAIVKSQYEGTSRDFESCKREVEFYKAMCSKSTTVDKLNKVKNTSRPNSVY